MVLKLISTHSICCEVKNIENVAIIVSYWWILHVFYIRLGQLTAEKLFFLREMALSANTNINGAVFTGTNKAISLQMSTLQRQTICCCFLLWPQSFQPSLTIGDALVSFRLKLFLLVFNSNNSPGKKKVCSKHGGIRDKGREVAVLFVHICKPSSLEKFSIFIKCKKMDWAWCAYYKMQIIWHYKTTMIFFKAYLDYFKIMDHNTWINMTGLLF